MTAKLANAAPIGKAPGRASRIRRVEALVTLAMLAWFAAALTEAVGELHRDRSAPAAQAAATSGLPLAPPQAAMLPASAAHATMSLI